MPKTKSQTLKIANKHHNQRKPTHPGFFPDLTQSENRPRGEVNIFSILALEQEIREHERVISKFSSNAVRNRC